MRRLPGQAWNPRSLSAGRYDCDRSSPLGQPRPHHLDSCCDVFRRTHDRMAPTTVIAQEISKIKATADWSLPFGSLCGRHVACCSVAVRLRRSGLLRHTECLGAALPGMAHEHFVACRGKTQSGRNGCVEVAFLDDRVAIRNSKQQHGAALIFTTTEWEAFLSGVRNGSSTFPDGT